MQYLGWVAELGDVLRVMEGRRNTLIPRLFPGRELEAKRCPTPLIGTWLNSIFL